jgi:hypothetical protein
MVEVDITSKEFLDKALENAKTWCSKNLPKHIKCFKNGFDYDIFRYLIDNEMISDMRLDEERGLIRVSTEKLKWHQQREDCFEKHKFPRYVQRGNEIIKIKGAVEVDPESMFVHDITESIIYTVPEVLLNYLLKIDPHAVAYQIENINRRERGLKEWPMF